MCGYLMAGLRQAAMNQHTQAVQYKSCVPSIWQDQQELTSGGDRASCSTLHLTE